MRTGHGRKTLGGRDSTAIFITWDDWGGFYDHVQPPKIDENAYLKLIEDRFLGSQRLDPQSDGRPDSRPTVREDLRSSATWSPSSISTSRRGSR